jgi:inorganic phosphate transporter, PiT family
VYATGGASELNSETLTVIVFSLALLYTFTNGFQDGSSVAATAIWSRAMPPWQAIVLVASAEFLGAYFGGSAVASAIQSITSYPRNASILLVLASALSAAIIWNFFTRWVRLPSSSTHALIGGVLGAVITEGGVQYVVMGNANSLLHPTGLWKVIISLFVSPLLGFLGGYVVFIVALFLLRNATTKITKWLNAMQVISVTALAFGHGANDTQKAMGVILLALNSTRTDPLTDIPSYVRILTGAAMVIGIISFSQGIVRRVGGGIFKLHTIHALTAQASAAAIVAYGSATGGPVSASQIISSSVVGVGAAQRRKGVHWKVVQDMLLAWLFTIPGAALLAAVLHRCIFHWLRYAFSI